MAPLFPVGDFESTESESVAEIGQVDGIVIDALEPLLGEGVSEKCWEACEEFA